MLRRLAKVSLMMAIVASILFGAWSASFAAGEINYEEFFAQALKQDSGTAAAYTAEVTELFDSDPEGFIKALYQAPSKQIESINVSLASGHYKDLPGFRQQILEFLEDEAFEEEAPLLNQILEAISYHEDLLNRIAAANAKDRPPSERDTYPFHPELVADKIRERRDSGRLDDVDEEFSNWLMEIYCLDPDLFAKCVAPFDNEDIEIIAQRIVNALAKVSKVIPDKKRPLMLNARETETLELLEKGIAKNQAIVEQTPSTEGPDSTIQRADEHPYFDYSTIQWSTLPLEILDTERLNFTICETDITRYRSILVELHVYRNGTWWLKGSKWVSMPAGMTRISSYIDLTFDEPGTLQTRLRVYAQNGTYLTDQWTESSTKVYAEWRIEIRFNQVSRDLYGKLRLYNAHHVLIDSPVNCLGQSEYPNRTMREIDGPTPTGETGGQLLYRMYPESSYGDEPVIWLDPYYSGVFKAVEGIRTGILIHGGDEADGGGLNVTRGCVRVTNEAHEWLVEEITELVDSGYYERGFVTVQDVSNP